MAGKAATDYDKRLGARLKKIRVVKGVSQRAIAAHLEMSPAQLQKYENGTNCMSVSAMQRTAVFLGVSPLELMDPEVASLTPPDDEGLRARALVQAEELVRILRGEPESEDDP